MNTKSRWLYVSDKIHRIHGEPDENKIERMFAQWGCNIRRIGDFKPPNSDQIVEIYVGDELKDSRIVGESP